MAEFKIYGAGFFSPFIIVPVLLILAPLHLIGAERTCYGCYYVGPPLNKDAYPCMEKYVETEKDKENPAVSKVECTMGEDFCYYHLRVQTMENDRKLAVLRGGCLLEQSRKCIEDTGMVTLDTKGTCSTATSPTFEQFWNVDACVHYPDGSEAFQRGGDSDLFPSHDEKQNETSTICVCDGKECNGPGGSIKL